MKSYYGNYLGMVINNNDPEFRGRIQVFVPHIMPTLYEGWNQDGEDITINCVGDNMPQGLTSPVVNKLKQILPWAEAASPIVGQGISGQITESAVIDSVGSSVDPALILNQTPTTTVAGSHSSSTEFLMPTEASINTKLLKPGFIQRVNSLYEEATALGYKMTCTSGYRSTEYQTKLYNDDIAKHGGKPSGAVAKPGNSTHELGIAVDLKVIGNGVSITKISAAAEQDGTNRDTPEWRALLAKHGLHQPLHPKNVPTPSVPESWHVEPIETPKAKQGDRVTVPRMVAEKLSDVSPKIGETTSSSQFPPLPNPIEQSSPSNTDNTEAINSKTGKVPVLAPSSAANTASVAITSGPNSGSTVAEGTNQLAKDRIAYFRGELNDPEILNRIEFVTKKEGGSSGRLIFETACNRAFFSNRSLKEVLFEKAYFKDANKDPNANKTIPHTQFALDMIKNVIYNGANETDLATDQAYNDKNLFAKKFIDGGAQGSWFDLNTGKKITNPGRITQLSTTPGSGNEEFIYQKSGHGPNASSKTGHAAKAYGIKYGIKPTTPSTFIADTPLPKELEDARKSSLTGEPLGTNKPPVTVNNTDKHGPTIVKNTNDSAKGLFAFPGVGAMVWVFFREGNPLFPVYFAASYSSNEWKSAYNATALNPEGANQGSIGTQAANSMKLNPNAGGGLEFTHIKDTSDPSGAGDKTVAMMYGDDGSNIVFAKGYHQIYSRHDRRDQIDGHLYSTIHGAEERWVEEDSSINVRGNVFIKIGKIDNETIEAMKELSDFSKNLNDTLMTNSSK